MVLSWSEIEQWNTRRNIHSSLTVSDVMASKAESYKKVFNAIPNDSVDRFYHMMWRDIEVVLCALQSPSRMCFMRAFIMKQIPALFNDDLSSIVRPECPPDCTCIWSKGEGYDFPAAFEAFVRRIMDNDPWMADQERFIHNGWKGMGKRV